MEEAIFLKRLAHNPKMISFGDTMEVIGEHYFFEPTHFINGAQTNAAGQNNGSCKVFSFAVRHGLTEHETLLCFGEYYRDVLEDLEGDNHPNIRNFMQTGWKGIQFEREALRPKKP